MSAPLTRSRAFCDAHGLEVPILMAPMAGASPPALAAAVAGAGGMGGCGALAMPPQAIHEWMQEFRTRAAGPVQLNLWVPDPPPARDPAREARLCDFLARWGPKPEPPDDAACIDFEAQCDALLVARPDAISSIMGLYPARMIAAMRARAIPWFATATTLAEARAAEAAGADAIIAQGSEAGGHRGAFEAAKAGERAVGLFALVPAIADAVRVPVIAAGGIADARGVAAALQLGAAAVMLGTAFLRSLEAGIAPTWAQGLAGAAPEDTTLTRALSGRLARSLRTGYVAAAADPGAPAPAPYPVQRALTVPMRAAAAERGELAGMQAWAGQSAARAREEPAGQIVTALWEGARDLLAGAR